MIDINEKQLLQAAIGGDRRAADDLLEPCRGILTGYFQRHLSDPFAAEELVQEVFVAAFTGLSRFSGERPIGSWMLGIANNKLKNHYERDPIKSGKVTHLDTAATEEILREGVNSLSQADFALQTQSRDRIDQLLKCAKASCSVDEYQILLLIYQGETPEEIAELLDRNANTIRSLLKRGREKLLEYLVVHEPEVLGGSDAIHSAWQKVQANEEVTLLERAAWKARGGRGKTDMFRAACLKMARYLPTASMALIAILRISEKGQ